MQRNFRRRQAGQSLPILALLIVVIIGMVALSVDVGNAYGQQRRVQNAANAGALAAMNSAVRNNTNVTVWNNVKRTLAANRIDMDSGQYDVKADYIFSDANRQPQRLGQRYGSVEDVPNPNGNPPQGVVRVQVTVTERVDTYFARVVGRDVLTVNANGSACLGSFGNNVYPIAIPLKLNKTVHDVFNAGSNTAMSTSSTVWNEVEAGNWTNMVGKDVFFDYKNKQGGTLPPGSHTGWLNWGVENGNSALSASLTYPGNLTNGFREGTNADSSMPTNPPNGQFEPLDWVNGQTGVSLSNAARDAINEHVSAGATRTFILPMYQKAVGNGSNASFYITSFGRFQLTGFNHNGSNSTLRVRYLGPATMTPTTCSGEPAHTVETRTFNIEGVARVNRVWRENRINYTNDIVLVMDTSGSMNFDWYDRRPGAYMADGRDEPGYSAANARIHDAKAAIKDFVRNYDLSDDPDARISFISFGGEGNINQATRVQNNWTTSGCTAAQAADNSCPLDTRWRTIQQNADGLTATGGTPGPYAFERVIEQLQSAQSTRNGKPVRKIVIFATDGVFNVCGSTPNSSACPRGQTICTTGTYDQRQACMNDPRTQALEPRPVWQGQQRSNDIKGLGASIFIIALQPQCTQGSGRYCFDPYGLSDMSSGDGYFYSARDEAALASVYTQIRAKMYDTTCVPQERAELAPGATIRLIQPGNPLFSRSVTADSVDGSYRFTDLPPGQYAVKADAWTYTSPEDRLQRSYSRVRNALNLAEEGQSSVYLNPQFPDGATVYSEVLLALPNNSQGVPHNGCTMPN